jgi:hypothetical protein
MSEQLQKDAAFIQSINILKKLLEMNLINPDEYAKVRALSANYYGSKIIVLEALNLEFSTG